MCDKCQQLETDIQRYRKRLEQSLDPLTIEIQRSRKLLALGLDPLSIERIDGVIRELVQHKPANAQQRTGWGRAPVFRLVAAGRPPAS